MNITRNPTRSVRIGTVTIGAGHPIAVQSMTATPTRDIDATVAQVNALAAAGADVVRIAVDSPAEADAVAEIRRQTTANLVVDLQENYRLAERLAPHVDKLRYNPGHLYHHERTKPWQEKVRYLVEIARDNDCAIRVGVNCGSVDPAQQAKYDPADRLSPMLDSALDHCRLLDELGLHALLRVAQGFRSARGDRSESPLRRGAAGRAAAPGRDRSRPAAGRHHQNADRASSSSSAAASATRFACRSPCRTTASRRKSPPAGRFLHDIAAGRVRSVVDYGLSTLNIISCPSCSRVENEAFVELAEDVKRMTDYAREHKITIAVMGCRVNGPGETDDADLGLWCGPNYVNLKRGSETLGQFPYDAILPRLKQELDLLIAAKCQVGLATD